MSRYLSTVVSTLILRKVALQHNTEIHLCIDIRYLFAIFSLSQDFLLNDESEERKVRLLRKIGRDTLKISYQVWRTREGVSLPTPSLTVAEDGGGEAVHPHVD